MGMTMTQKILAAHAGLDAVTAGQLVEAKLDVVMANDITGPMAVPVFRQMADKVFDKNKVVLVPYWYRIILHRTRISNRRRIPNQSGNSQKIRD